MPRDAELEALVNDARQRGMLARDPELRQLIADAEARGMIAPSKPAPNKAVAQAPPVAPSPTARTIGRPGDTESEIAGEMGALERGEHLQGGRPSLQSLIHSASREIKAAQQTHPEFPLPQMITSGLNEAARQWRAGGGILGGQRAIGVENGRIVPGPTIRGFYQGARRAFEATKAGKPLQESPQAARIALGVTAKTTTLVRWPAAAADFVISIRTDPYGKLLDPSLRGLGEAAVGAVRKALPQAGRIAAATAGRVAQRWGASPLARVAEEYAVTGAQTAIRSGKPHFSAGDIARLQGMAKAAGVDPDAVAQKGNVLLAKATAALAKAEAAGRFAHLTDPVELRQARRALAKQVLRRGTAGGKAEAAVEFLTVPGVTRHARRFVGNAAAFAGLGPRAPQVAADTRRAINAAGGVFKAWKGAVGIGKGALVGNPATTAGNSVGGYLMSKLALDSVGLNGDLLHAHLGAAVREAMAAAKGTVSADIAELSGHSNAFGQTIAGAAAVGLPQAKARPLGSAALAIPKAFLSAQDFSDKTFKLATYKALRAAGKDPKTAAKLVDRYLFDYGDRSALVEFADRFGFAPFSTFGAKAFRAFVDGVVSRPDLARRFLAARARAFADPQARKDYEQLPASERGLFTLPLGHSEFLQLDKFNPVGGSIKTIQQLRDFARGKLDVPQALREQITRPLPAAAALNLGLNQQVLGEYDRPRRISDPGAPFWDRVPVHLRELARSYGGRNLMGVIEAIEGKTASDAPGAEAAPITAALLRSMLGLRATKAQAKEAYSQRRGELEQKRRDVALPFMLKVHSDAEAHASTNPFLKHVRGLARDDAERQLQMTEKYIDALLTSGRTVDRGGRLTPEGRRRIANAVRYRAALQHHAEKAR